MQFLKALVEALWGFGLLLFLWAAGCLTVGAVLGVIGIIAYKVFLLGAM